MWLVGDFEGATLKCLVDDIAKYYAEDEERYFNGVDYIEHNSGREFPLLVKSFNKRVEGLIEEYKEEFESEANYNNQVRSYYYSTRGC